jgi:hypothetical protein
LNAQRYRILPEDELNPITSVRLCELVVPLLGAAFDSTENNRRVVDAAMELNKKLVIWPSPSLEKTQDLPQRGFFNYLKGIEYAGKTLLPSSHSPEKLKQEVLSILNPHAKIPLAPGGKPRVYLVYDSSQDSDNAGKIAYQYRDEFHFDRCDDYRRHRLCLTQSDAVLLIWGQSAEDWWADEFEQMVRLSNQTKSRGLCLFDPQESKMARADEIRQKLDPTIHISNQFGDFEKARLDPFFAPIRRTRTETAQAGG